MSRQFVQLKSRAGDTLVEVMIVIGIISLILTGAYVTTNRNLLTARDSQERVNALKLAESQVELIRSVSHNRALDLIAGVPAAYCLSGSSTVAIVQTNDNDSDLRNTDNCTFYIDGELAGTRQPAFRLIILPPPDTCQQTLSCTFTIKSKWFSTRGEIRNVTLRYRAY